MKSARGSGRLVPQSVRRPVSRRGGARLRLAVVLHETGKRLQATGRRRLRKDPTGASRSIVGETAVRVGRVLAETGRSGLIADAGGVLVDPHPDPPVSPKAKQKPTTPKEEAPRFPVIEAGPKRERKAKKSGPVQPKLAEQPPKQKKPGKLTSFERELQSEANAVRAALEKVASRDQPVIAGPYYSEVGFELLYWIPLLRWALREFPELEGRVVAVSRGGVDHWYAGIASRYVDVFSLYTREEFVTRRGSQKQREVADFEMELYRNVADGLELPGFDVIHPSLLFNTYYRVLKAEQRGYAHSVVHDGDGCVRGLTATYEPLAPRRDDRIQRELPAEYVAARFYWRPSFPASPENRDFSRRLVASIASRVPVVLLNNGLELDDHSELDDFGDRDVYRIDHLMSVHDNLGVQTAALSGARVFVGTYGGLAYLAPFLGVPSVSFSSHPEHTHAWHLELAQNVFAGSRWPSLAALDTRDVDALELVLGGR